MGREKGERHPGWGGVGTQSGDGSPVISAPRAHAHMRPPLVMVLSQIAHLNTARAELDQQMISLLSHSTPKRPKFAPEIWETLWEDFCSIGVISREGTFPKMVVVAALCKWKRFLLTLDKFGISASECKKRSVSNPLLNSDTVPRTLHTPEWGKRARLC